MVGAATGGAAQLHNPGAAAGLTPAQEDDIIALPWPGPAADYAAVAAGLVVPGPVAHWRARAQCVTLAHAGGVLTAHHWPAAPAPGACLKAPVVLLHGGSGSWTHWLRMLGPLTQAGHPVWALDMPGFGASDPLPGQQDADDMLPVLAAGLRHWLGGQPVQIMGFSLGGMTAALLAAAYPALVRQLLLVGPPGLGLRDKPIYRLRGWRHLEDAQEQLRRHCYNLAALMLCDTSLIDRDTLALHTANVQRDRLPRRRLASTDVLRRTLPRLACPVQAVYGEQDVLYRGLWPQVADCFNGQLQLLPGAGHWVQYEAPQAFAELVLPRLW